MEDIKQGFTPIPRMCLRKVKSKGVPIVEFICISWHGRHNKAKLEDLIEEFKSMLKYILKLPEKLLLPVFLAGDSVNVTIKDIETLVPPSLVLHKYKPTERRAPENIIDFFISSKSLVMSDINALTLKSTENEYSKCYISAEEEDTYLDLGPATPPPIPETRRHRELTSLFDHDPVVLFMSTKTENEYSKYYISAEEEDTYLDLGPTRVIRSLPHETSDEETHFYDVFAEDELTLRPVTPALISDSDGKTTFSDICVNEDDTSLAPCT